MVGGQRVLSSLLLHYMIFVWHFFEDCLEIITAHLPIQYVHENSNLLWTMAVEKVVGGVVTQNWYKVIA